MFLLKYKIFQIQDIENKHLPAIPTIPRIFEPKYS